MTQAEFIEILKEIIVFLETPDWIRQKIDTKKMVNDLTTVLFDLSPNYFFDDKNWLIKVVFPEVLSAAKLANKEFPENLKNKMLLYSL